MVTINKKGEDSIKTIGAAIAGAALGAAAATAMANPKFKKKITSLAKQAKDEWEKIKIEAKKGEKLLAKRVKGKKKSRKSKA